ncbi:MAG: TetR/AcrR family transcriptional regulator [Nocardioidaceae bacterium]|nr:TetR/AcrR family transcriptional regulator [Nocardioidaceae bacterium]
MSPPTTTDRILDSAETLFFTDGIAVTGVDRVAASAGVAIATLYKHVGSKDGLLEAVLERRLRSWTEHWDAAIEAADSPTDELLAVFDAVTSFRASAGATQWCSFLATASERPHPPGAGADPVLDLVDRDTRLVTDRLRELARSADLDDPQAVASSLLLLYNGVLGSLLRGTPDDPVALARRLALSVVTGSTGRTA